MHKELIMKKILLCTLAAVWPVCGLAAEGVTEDEMIVEALADPNLQESVIDKMSMYDVNSDGAISVTEIEALTSGLGEQEMEAFRSLDIHSGKDELVAMMQGAFAAADIDDDKMLRGEEIAEFGREWEMFILKQKFKSMDRNGDGVLNIDDVPPAEESMQKLEEATKKVQALAEKLEQIDPEDAARNMFIGFGTAAAKEDFIQMDKDKDGCVTKDEYADYQVEQQEMVDEDGEDSSYKLSREDYLGLFTREEKKNPKCLTMDEYVANEAKSISDMSEHFGAQEDNDADPEPLEGYKLQIVAEEYDNMDKDKNYCVTADEYVEYNVKVQDEITEEDKGYMLSREDYEGMYKSIEKDDPQCVTKEEYLADRAKAFSRLATDTDEDKRVAELMFAEMDEDEDGKLTQAEYVKYEMSVHPAKMADEKTFEGIFSVYEGSEKGWLSKEEFVSGYIED